MRRFILSAVALAVLGTSSALASDQEYFDDRVHSDIPIYTFHYDEIWPRGFLEEGAIGGCTSRVAFGDWKFKPNPDGERAEEWWLRIDNYGVFHCAANLYNADSRVELESARFTRGWFVRIGVEDTDEPKSELWLLQEGFATGSTYTLLARNMEEELVTSFTVLQRKCPIGAYREARGMGIWATGYCAINSDTDMYRFANEMLKLAPLGELTLEVQPMTAGKDAP